MVHKIAGPEIEHLIQLLARLPGLGPRSARRAALYMIRKRMELLEPLTQAMITTCERVTICRECGNIDTTDPCTICKDPKREAHTLVVVETVSDLWALERAQAVYARYHVLGGTLSPLDGITPKDLNLDTLPKRMTQLGIQEVILALNATVEGQTTAHYILDLLAAYPLTITRLAHGVPVGGELDYLDEGTLMAAIRQRLPLEG